MILIRVRALVSVAVLLAASVLLAPAAQAAAPRQAADRPVWVTSVLFRSVRGRQITAVHRYYPGRATRTVVVIGQTHGNEKPGKLVVDQLTTATVFPPTLDLWLVRSVNPDGDAAGTRTNAHHVDLNRNFPTRWRRTAGGTSTYAGPAPRSEPETRGLMTFLDRVRPDRVISLHAPLNGVDTTGKNAGLARALAAASGYPLKAFTCSGGCHGTTAQWYNASHPGAMIVFEFGRRTSTAQLRRVSAAVITAAAA